ncbi:uncharacterized protein LOC144903587 isoform X2 [Branchiostoma floridae x Branchiostoma belcheri]
MGDKERSALRPLHNTADAMGDRSQLTKKMFAWHKDPRVGRRTGIVMKKDMKKDADGFELISEYFSDTESEESSVLTEPSTKKQPKPKKDIRPRRMSSFSPIRPDSDLSRTSVSPAENPAPVENPGPAAEGSPTSPTPGASPTPADSPTPTASPPVVENPTSADSPTPTKSAASPAQEDGTSATPEIQSAANVSAGPEASPGLDAERNQSAQDVDVSSMNFTADDSGSISKISSQDPRTAVKPVAALKKRLTFGGASSDSPDTTAQKGSSVSLETVSSDKEATRNATEALACEKPTKQTKRKSQRQERAKAGKPSETTEEEETLGRRGARQQKAVVTEATENSRKDERGGPERATQEEEEDSSRASKKQKDQDKTAPKKVPGVKKQPLVVEMVDSDEEDDDLFCMKRFRVNLTNRQNTSTESQATKEPNADQIRTKNTSQQPAKKAKGDGQNDETAKNKKKGRPRKSAGKKNKEVDSETQPEKMNGSKQSVKEMRQKEPESQESRVDTVVDDVQREVPSVELEVEVHHEADGDSFNHSGLQDLVLPSDREEAEDEEIPVQPSPKLLTKTRSQKRGTSSETARVQKKFKPQPKERSNARGRRSGGQRSRSGQDSSASDGEVQKKKRGQARKDLSSQFLDESSEVQAEANSTAESHQETTEPKRRRASKAKESHSAPKRPGKQRQEASSPVEKGPDNSLTAVEEGVPVFDLSSQTAQESSTSDGEVRRRKRGRPRKAPKTAAQSSNESREIQSEANVSAGPEENTEPKKKRAKKNGRRPGKQRQPASSTEDNSDKTLSSGDDLPVSATPLRSILKGGKNHTPRSSTSTLPRASVTSPKHYANVTQSKSASKKGPADSARQAHIIAPRNDKTPGVRRSCRNRARPVAWWAQERVVYERRDSGRVMVDVKRPEVKDYGTRPRKTQITKGKSRPRKGATKTQQPLQQESVPDISTHTCTDVPRDWEDVENPVIPVVNPATKEEVLIDCVKTTSMFDFRGPQGRAATEEDGIKVCKALRQPQFGLGQIILEPRQEKGTQFVRNDTLAYVVMEGKLAVTIHRSTMKLQTGDMFLIPAGNTYNIRNLRNDRARLSFCQIKPSQQ